MSTPMDNSDKFDERFVTGIKLVIAFLIEEGHTSAGGYVIHDGITWHVEIEQVKEGENDGL